MYTVHISMSMAQHAVRMPKRVSIRSSVYRLLKARDLITSPAYVVIKAADRFHTQATRPNAMWQTFTYSAPRAHMFGMQMRK